MHTCDSTCVFTIGKMVSYSELLIFTRPSGIIDMPSIWRRSAFSLIAETRG